MADELALLFDGAADLSHDSEADPSAFGAFSTEFMTPERPATDRGDPPEVNADRNAVTEHGKAWFSVALAEGLAPRAGGSVRVYFSYLGAFCMAGAVALPGTEAVDMREPWSSTNGFSRIMHDGRFYLQSQTPTSHPGPTPEKTLICISLSYQSDDAAGADGHGVLSVTSQGVDEKEVVLSREVPPGYVPYIGVNGQSGRPSSAEIKLVISSGGFVKSARKR